MPSRFQVPFYGALLYARATSLLNLRYAGAGAYACKTRFAISGAMPGIYARIPSVPRGAVVDLAAGMHGGVRYPLCHFSRSHLLGFFWFLLLRSAAHASLCALKYL